MSDCKFADLRMIQIDEAQILLIRCVNPRQDPHDGGIRAGHECA